MTRLYSFLVITSLFTLTYTLLLLDWIPFPLNRHTTLLLLHTLPFNLLVALGAYCLAQLGLGLLTLSDCHNDYLQLMTVLLPLLPPPSPKLTTIPGHHNRQRLSQSKRGRCRLKN